MLLLKILLNIIAIIFLAAVALLVYVGAQPLPDAAWDRVQQAGVLKVGLEPTYKPFEYLDNGALKGYDVDLARQLAAKIGVKAEFVSIALDGQYDALAAGQVDVLISALPKVDERQGEVRYSQPYYNAGPLLVTPQNSALTSQADLAGKSVVVELGSDADLAARLLQNSLPTMRLDSSYHSADEALAAVAAGKADAAVCDLLSLADYLRQNAVDLRALATPLQDQFYVFAVKVDDRVLGPKLDDALQALRASGDLERIFSQ